MKTSKLGIDGIEINEENYKTQEEIRKFHLIKMNFSLPNEDKINTVIERFRLTNRYIISDNIRFYNNILKFRKKYYVENSPGVNFISFVKKNNKILLNFDNLTDTQMSLVKEEYKDILRNVEVISINEKTFTEEGEGKLDYGNGNVLIK